MARSLWDSGVGLGTNTGVLWRSEKVGALGDLGGGTQGLFVVRTNATVQIAASAVTGGATQYVRELGLEDGSDGYLTIYISGAYDRDAGPQVDLTPAVERDGRFLFQYKTHRLTVVLTDFTEPYVFAPANAADVYAFVTAWKADAQRATEPIRCALVDSTNPGIDLARFTYEPPPAKSIWDSSVELGAAYGVYWRGGVAGRQEGANLLPVYRNVTQAIASAGIVASGRATPTYVEAINLAPAGRVEIYFSDQYNAGAPGPDLTDALEATGRWLFEYKTHRLTVRIATDFGEPYRFAPSNATEVAAFVAAWKADAGKATEPIRSALVDSANRNVRLDAFTIHDPADRLAGKAALGGLAGTARLTVEDRGIELAGRADLGALAGSATLTNRALIDLAGTAALDGLAGRGTLRVTRNIRLAGRATLGGLAGRGTLYLFSPFVFLSGRAGLGGLAGHAFLRVFDPDDPSAIPPLLVHWLAEFPTSDPVYRFWSGAEDLTFDGKTYQGRNFISLSGADASLDAPNRRMTASFAVPTPELRLALMQDPGPLTVVIEWIVSDNQGRTWRKAPRKFVGRLSKPVIKDGVYTIEIETYGGDVDRGRPLKWSHEDQQARYPGDRGLEYMRQLSKGIADARWPP